MSRQGSVLREDSVREKQPPLRGTEEADRLIEEEEAAEGAVSITWWNEDAVSTPPMWGHCHCHTSMWGVVNITW